MGAEEPASRQGRLKRAVGSNKLFLIALLVLIGLKLSGVIAWSWWAVFGSGRRHTALALRLRALPAGAEKCLFGIPAAD